MYGAGVLRVLLLALLWGSSFLWTKLALRDLAPAQVVVVRLTLGALVLATITYALQYRLPRDGRTWAHLTVAAIFGNVAPYLLFAIGLQQVDSAVGGMLNATTPVWTTLIAIIAARNVGVSPLRVTGISVGLAGTLLVFAPWNLGSQFTSWGAVACLLAAICYAISYVYIARFLAPQRETVLVLSAAQLAVAAGLSLLIVLPGDGLALPSWHIEATIGAAILGILSTGVAYVLNYRIITDDGPVVASAVIYLLPVVAVMLGLLVLGEQVAWHAVAGVAVVLIGVSITRRAERRPNRAKP